MTNTNTVQEAVTAELKQQLGELMFANISMSVQLRLLANADAAQKQQTATVVVPASKT